MKNKSLVFGAFLLVVCSITAISSYSLTKALYQRGASSATVRIAEASTRTVTLYTNFEAGNWSSPNTIYVTSGNEIGSATSPSLSGYDFLGWRTTAPSSGDGNRSIEYTTDQLNDIVVGASDLTFYPVFKSNSELAYVNSNYYAINADVEINTNSIGSTNIGYRYLGVSGIFDITASWNDTRSLYSSSGIYRFVKNEGAALIQRKIGFKPNSHWGAAWDNDSCGFGIYSWQGGNNSSIHLGNTTSGNTLYTYIPADYENFLFRRYSSNKNAFEGNDANSNKSSDLSFDNSWYWNGSSTNKYSKDTIVLQMNNWGDWINEWNSSNASWVAS